MALSLTRIVLEQDDAKTKHNHDNRDKRWPTQSWYVDPKEELIGILMTQRLWDTPSPPSVLLDFWTSAYRAIDD